MSKIKSNRTAGSYGHAGQDDLNFTSAGAQVISSRTAGSYATNNQASVVSGKKIVSDRTAGSYGDAGQQDVVKGSTVLSERVDGSYGVMGEKVDLSFGPQGASVNSSGNLSVSTGDFVSSGVAGGPFAPSSKLYTLTNIGGTVMDWSASGDVDWITVEPASGVLQPGESSVVAVTINANANNLTGS